MTIRHPPPHFLSGCILTAAGLLLPPGTLGLVRTAGRGPRAMLLTSGPGFGADIWTEFMESRKEEYAMSAVTLPGFGETPPLPIPPEGSLFADLPWTRSSDMNTRRPARRAMRAAH